MIACRLRRMVVQSTHDVIDAASLQQAVKRVPPMPKHMKLLALLPTKDLARVTCVWQADSIREVRSYVEPIVKEATRNAYVELDSRLVQGVGAS